MARVTMIGARRYYGELGIDDWILHRVGRLEAMQVATLDEIYEAEEVARRNRDRDRSQASKAYVWTGMW